MTGHTPWREIKHKSDRINLAELREAAENDGESSTTVYIGGPGWNTVLALVEAVEAAEPLARLPLPVSSDERVDWLTCQQRLRDALSVFDFGGQS